MTPNLIHFIYNVYTTRLYSWDFYTSVKFWTITLQMQWCFWTQKALGLKKLSISAHKIWEIGSEIELNVCQHDKDMEECQK